MDENNDDIIEFSPSKSGPSILKETLGTNLMLMGTPVQKQLKVN